MTWSCVASESPIGVAIMVHVPLTGEYGRFACHSPSGRAQRLSRNPDETTTSGRNCTLMPSTEEETKPVELGFEEIADQLLPANPKMSPDGRAVAFTVTARSRKGEQTERAIWLSRHGEQATRFSGGESDDREVSFSPDGTPLGFLSNRKNPKKSAIYPLPLASRAISYLAMDSTRRQRHRCHHQDSRDHMMAHPLARKTVEHLLGNGMRCNLPRTDSGREMPVPSPYHSQRHLRYLRILARSVLVRLRLASDLRPSLRSYHRCTQQGLARKEAIKQSESSCLTPSLDQESNDFHFTQYRGRPLLSVEHCLGISRSKSSWTQPHRHRPSFLNPCLAVQSAFENPEA